MSPRRALPIALLAPLAALGLAWLLQPERETRAVARPEGAGEEPGPVLARPDLRAPRATRSPVGELLAGGIPLTIRSEGLELPPDGIEVAYLDEASVTARRFPGQRDGYRSVWEHAGLVQPTHDPVAVAWEHGRRVQPTADGVWLIPPPSKRGTLVVARHGTVSGFVEVAPGDPEILLDLEPERSVTVLVVDDAVEPVAGAPLRFGWGDTRFPWSAKTDGDGIVRIDDLRRLIDPDEEPVILVEGHFREPVQAAIDPDRLPERPVVLRLPPVGSVALKLPDELRDVPIERVRIDLAGGTRPFRRNFGHLGPEDVEDGWVIYPFVETGLELRAQVVLPEVPTPIERGFRGPARPGARTRFTFPERDDLPTLAGRIVRDDGSPLVSDLVAGFDAGQFLFLATDDEGVFRTLLTAPSPPAGETVELEHEGSRLTLALPDPLRPGETWLGDLVLQGPSVFLSGRAVDDEGAPLASARIQAWRIASYPVNVRPGETPPRPRRSFVRVGDLDVQTDREGRFELRGFDAAGELAVTATSGRHYFDEPVPFSVGDEDVEVVLERGGGLEGSLLLSPDIPARSVRVVVRSGYLETDIAPQWAPNKGEPDAAGIYRFHRYYRSERPRIGGGFRIASVRPGRARVSVEIPGESRPILELEVDVPAGEVTELERIDLRGRLQVNRLRIVDTDGRPVDRAEVRVLEPGGEEWRKLPGFGSARAFPTLPRPVDVQVWAMGYRPERVSVVTGEEEVVLRRGIPLRLVLPPGLELPEPPLALGVRVQAGATPPDGREAIWRLKRWESHFDEKREILLRLPAPGTWKVEWILARKKAGLWMDERRLPGARSIRIRLEDDPLDQVHHVSPPAAALEEALDRGEG